MTSGVLCCGNLVRDIAVSPVSQVIWGRSIWVDSIEEGCGGNGAITSYALAKLGTPARLAGMVGADEAGDRVLAILRSAGVDTAHVRRSSLPTPTTVALVNPDGARALLHRLGASREAFQDPIEFTSELTRGCSWFHLGNPFALPELRSHAGELVAGARQAGLSVSIDTGWDPRGEWMHVLGPCLQHADVLFVNEEESRELTGLRDPMESARELQRHGVRNVVVKLGAAGCLVCWGEDSLQAPAFTVRWSTRPGQGTASPWFLAALQHGFSYAEAARFANAVGRAQCTETRRHSRSVKFR